MIWVSIHSDFLNFNLCIVFQYMVATPTGEAGQSVTSLVVVGTGRGHVPVPILYPNMAGSTARILVTRCSLMCVIQGPVHVSIIEDSLRCRFFENRWETQPSSSWKIFLYLFYSWQSNKNLRTHQRSFWVIKNGTVISVYISFEWWN